VKNPKDKPNYAGSNWVNLSMRSIDPTGKYIKKKDFSIIAIKSGLTLNIEINPYVGADT
jgi:hypothetical protein